jgi:hypothetical protein
MDQTSFSLGAGLMVGAPLGGAGLYFLTRWSFWITFPVGALIGFFVFSIVTFLLIEGVGRLLDHMRRKGR